MAASSSRDVTKLLLEWSAGESDALDKLTPLVYRELYRIARNCMAKERPNHTLQASALINEAYLKLVDSSRVRWESRAHFFAVSAQLMRRVLVDLARRRHSHKRGDGAANVSFDENVVIGQDEDLPDLVALDEALRSLTAMDARKGQIVELRFFAGLSVQETAAVLRISEITVQRDWKIARVWLRRELKKESHGA